MHDDRGMAKLHRGYNLSRGKETEARFSCVVTRKGLFGGGKMVCLENESKIEWKVYHMIDLKSQTWGV